MRWARLFAHRVRRCNARTCLASDASAALVAGTVRAVDRRTRRATATRLGRAPTLCLCPRLARRRGCWVNGQLRPILITFFRLKRLAWTQAEPPLALVPSRGLVFVPCAAATVPSTSRTLRPPFPVFCALHEQPQRHYLGGCATPRPWTTRLHCRRDYPGLLSMCWSSSVRLRPLPPLLA